MNELSHTHKKNGQLRRTGEEPKLKKIQDENAPVQTPTPAPEIVAKPGKLQRLGNVLFGIIFIAMIVLCILTFSCPKTSIYVDQATLKIALICLLLGLTLSFLFSKK
jgi:hypothetical protein